MVWPFSRRRRASSTEPETRSVAEEDREVYQAVRAWLEVEEPALRADQSPDGVLQVMRGETVVPVFMAHARKGKLVRLEVHDPTVRPLVDRLVKAFEGKGLWSFNGVVRTVAPGES